MLCPKCGAKNQEDAVFCENCGANISRASTQTQTNAWNQEDARQIMNSQDSATPSPTYTNQAATPYAVRVRKPVKKSVKIVTGIVLFLIIAIVALYNVALHMFSPEKAASNYFETLRTKDWNATYSFLSMPKSDFINKGNFIKNMKKGQIPEIINYSVSSDNTATDTINKTITVQYTTQNSPSQQTMKIDLIKQPEKAFFFFDTWKVSPTDYITPELTITIPKGATAYLDDTKVTDKYKDNSNSSADSTSSNSNSGVGTSLNEKSPTETYKLTNILAGNYTLKVTSKYTEDFSKNISLKNENSTETVDSLNLKKETLDEVSKKPEEIIKNIYQAAFAGKDFDSIKDYFAPDENTQSDMKSRYENVLDTISKGNDGGFKSITLSDFDSSVTDSKAGSDMAITVDSKFNYAFTAVGPTFDPASPAQDYTGNNSGDMTCYFKLCGDKWLISSISNLVLSNYSSNQY